MQVNPQEQIQLATLLSDPLDTGTYYVRCVMRDTLSNEVLDTVNLTQDPNNNRRFYGAMTAPSNLTMVGRYINITTSIYTDAGYSAYSAEYQETIDRYIVAYRWNQVLGGAGSGDPFANQGRQVTDIVRKELVKFLHLFKKMKKLEQLLEDLRSHVDSRESPGIGFAVEDLQEAISAAIADAMDEAGIHDGIKELKKSSGEMGPLVERAARDMSGSSADLAESARKIAEAADLVISSNIYSGHKSVDLNAPRERAEPGMGELLAQPSRTPRAPTDGVLPAHVIESGRKKMRVVPAPVVPVPEEKMNGEASLAEGMGIDKPKRAPSAGVIPHHVIARSRRVLAPTSV